MAKWKNWAGNQTSNPTSIKKPRSEADVAAIVAQAAKQRLRVKAVGSGHSFTGIARPEEIMIDMSSLNTIINLDEDNLTVTVGAGIVLSDLNQYLESKNFSMPNLGDVTYQTVSGAISTSTHGTGLQRSGLAAQLTAFHLVVASGEIIICNEQENSEVFHVGRVSLGALGIITQMTLRVVPLFRLHAVEQPMKLDVVLRDFDNLIRNNDFFEFYWIPHTRWALTKINNVTTRPIDPPARIATWWNKLVIENLAFGVLCRVGRRFPSLIPRLATALPSTGKTEYVNVSHKIFSSKRIVRFYEMEYSIELPMLVPALKELVSMIDDRGFKVSFPVEVRCTGSDDVSLSTSFGRSSAYIAVHMYQGCDYEPYFSAVEQIMMKYAGRPHWGKIHNQDGSQLASLYPQYQRFIEVRNQLDPEGVFTNDYLRRVLGS